MMDVHEALARHGLPPQPELPESPLRFEDGSTYRYEIASVEGPEVLSAVIDAAARHDVRVDRVSQGSGVWLLDDAEIAEMVSIGREQAVEVCLFLGPRGAWDVGGQALVTDVAAGVARGIEGVTGCVQDAMRACELGIRSLLVGDMGVLQLLAQMRDDGDFPADLKLKASAILAIANPLAARLCEELGADSLNLATDLDHRIVAGIRAATSLSLDVYLEAPDDMGGFVRTHTAAELVRVAAPVYLKFGLRNARHVYPSGGHLVDVAILQAREKVRRAALCERQLLRTTAGSLDTGGPMKLSETVAISQNVQMAADQAV